MNDSVVVTLLMTGFLAIISADIEGRGWTPPFPFLSTGLKTTTVPTPTGFGIRITTTKTTQQQTSVCQNSCCRCSNDQTQIECRGSNFNCQVKIKQMIQLNFHNQIEIKGLPTRSSNSSTNGNKNSYPIWISSTENV